MESDKLTAMFLRFDGHVQGEIPKGDICLSPLDLGVPDLGAACLIQQVNGFPNVISLIALENGIVAIDRHDEVVIFIIVGADLQRDRPDINRLAGSK